MTLPNRMHGKVGPFNESNLKICPHCRSRFFAARIMMRGTKTVKVCPNCGRTLPVPRPKPGLSPKSRAKPKLDKE